MPLDTAPEQTQWGIALSSGSFSPATTPISSIGAKRALGSKTSSLSESGLCICEPALLISHWAAKDNLALLSVNTMSPSPPGCPASAGWDEVGWGWHSQDQVDPSGGSCCRAAGSCGLCSNIHELEQHKLSAFPKHRLLRA